MPSRQFLFSWKVAAHGHEWIDAPMVEHGHVAESPSRVLVPKQRKNIEYRYYEPLRRETALFRQLAALPIEQAAIVEFADRYGLLAENQRVAAKGGSIAIDLFKTHGQRIPVRSGDSWDSWVNRILSLRTCIALWEKALSNDKPFLNSVITLVPNEDHLEWLSALVRFSVTGVILPAKGYFANPMTAKAAGRFRGKCVPLGEPGGVFVAAMSEVEPPASFHVGERLGFRVSPKPWEGQEVRGFGVTFPTKSIDHRNPIAVTQALVTTEIMRNLTIGLAPVIQPHANIGWGELRFLPKCLIDAIWLQFAEAVCGNKTYRQCLTCGKPFELSPDVARTSRLFCSDSCKMQSYRQRKIKTADLWDQGYPVQEIAEAVGSDAAYVRKWVARHLAARGATKREVGEKLGISVSQVARLLTAKKGKKR